MPLTAPIAQVETLHCVEPVDRSSDLDGSNATLVVRITDADGVSGIGECDAPPEPVAALFSMPAMHAWAMDLTQPLIGQDPIGIASLWQQLYQATLWHGRRGLGIHALSAIDIALHDLLGQRLGVPVWALLGGARRQRLRPYATIFPGLPGPRPLQAVLDQMWDQFESARRLGFRAVKMEVLFEDKADDQDLVGIIREGRARLGPQMTMMLDFGYRWTDWHDALWLLEQIRDQRIYFAEAPLQHDDLDGHRHLARRSPIRICGAEAAATRFEVREWIEQAEVAVVQPDLGRAGGFTEMRRIADLCELMGVQCIPHGWKTGITATAGLHFQAACPNVPFIEYLHPDLYDSALRRLLVEPAGVTLDADGCLSLPQAPGLGVRLNESALHSFLRPTAPALTDPVSIVPSHPTGPSNGPHL